MFVNFFQDAMLQNTCIDVDTFMRPIWHLCFGGGEYHMQIIEKILLF